MTDPRILRTKEAVRRGTLAVLADRGFVNLTVEAVAKAAGVAKSTIYRHWPTKVELIEDSLQALNEQPPPKPSGSTPMERIRELLKHLADAFSDSTFSACIPALSEAAEHSPEVAGFLHRYNSERRAILREAIQDAIDNDDLSSHLDADYVSLALAGAILYRRTMGPTPLKQPEVDVLLRGVIGTVSRPS